MLKTFSKTSCGRSYGTIKKPPNLITRETPHHIFVFSRASRAPRTQAPPSDLRQINSAILKVADDAFSC
jgi:hypothetical protein